MEGYDAPIYTNVRYPIDTTHRGCRRITDRLLPLHFTVEDTWRERANADYFRWRQLGVSSVVQWRVGRLFAGQSPAGGVRSQPLSASGDNRLCGDGHALERRQLAEDQDMWRMSGIFRSVWLLNKPQQRLCDVQLTPALDALYRDGTLQVQATIEATEAALVGLSVGLACGAARSRSPPGGSR